MIGITVRFFNSLSRYANGKPQFPLLLKEPRTIGDVVEMLKVPESEIFLLLHNGRNVMQGFGFNSGIEKERVLKEGDILAFSGPVPFSRGYGSAVV
jgi:hypothetical protein